MNPLTERGALDLIRATATQSVPNCINLPAIDRILADVAPSAEAVAAAAEKDGVVPASALFWKGAALKAATPSETEFNMREAYNHVVGQLYAYKRNNDRLVDETHRWSAAVKRLEAERVAPSTTDDALLQEAETDSQALRLDNKPYTSNLLTRLVALVRQLQAKLNFQSRVAVWMQETFGPEVSADFTERGFRFGEEAIELLQANGTTKEDVLKLVDYVYSRPVGELPQEVGGTMVTLASLCAARGIDLMALADTEQTRVESPEVRAKIQAKQEDKRRRMIATPLPGQV